MKIEIEGHSYSVKNHLGDVSHIDFYLDSSIDKEPNTSFVKDRNGTTCQELIRVLIDRVKFLDNQKPSKYNEEILKNLRLALSGFEFRALTRDIEEGKPSGECEKKPLDERGHWK